jgi:hypothetical protein
LFLETTSVRSAPAIQTRMAARTDSSGVITHSPP